MWRTRVTEMLGIDYPILQGGMRWVGDARLAAAVSNAGGFGVITASNYADPRLLREEIKRCKELTDKPFGVNLSILPQFLGERVRGYIDVVIDEQVTGVETSGRNPEEYLPLLKEGGVKVIHKVPAVRFAQKAENIGVDAVILVGVECGGLPGMDEVTTFILIQKATRVLKIPVIAGGGICDARGLVAALALGADGVLMGTRFMLTHDSLLHERIKARMRQASELDTIIVGRLSGNAVRVLKNQAAMRLLAVEKEGSLDQMRSMMGEGIEAAMLQGDPEAGLFACGQVVGLIDEIMWAREIIEEMVSGARDIFQRLAGMGLGGV